MLLAVLLYGKAFSHDSAWNALFDVRSLTHAMQFSFSRDFTFQCLMSVFIRQCALRLSFGMGQVPISVYFAWSLLDNFEVISRLIPPFSKHKIANKIGGQHVWMLEAELKT